ncbi:unnamed protein product [Staurois parvus]|uniref:Uncharacterized protein n=1 Tax=Staurois parvus TaxID=386267 RepID=A0ABN9GZ15_9NEOB|nr:unnamed protein product [Staurois parvus]
MATPSSTGQTHFVDQNREKLIGCIDNVEVVLSQLLQDNLLVSEEYEAVRTRTTNRERMSKLFSFIQDWTNSQKDKLYQALKLNYPATVRYMEKTMEQEEDIETCINTHRENLKRHFQLVKDRNSRMGERAVLRRRYTKLVLLRKFRGEEEKKRELSSSGEEQAQILIDRSSSEEYSSTSVEELFDPDDDGVVPKTVIIHGPTGIGKSLTAHKIICDWATYNLYEGKFDFFFYISYKDFNKITKNVSLAGLLAKTSGVGLSPRVLRNILSRRERLGFLISSFDQMKCNLRDQGDLCQDPFEETHKDVLLRSLLKGQLAKGASLIITTRTFLLDQLQTFLPDPPRHVEIVGYTAEAREYYIRAYFGSIDTEMAVDITKRNEVLFSLCTVPFMCWVVSTVTRQQISNYPSNFTTDTSMFLYYLKGLILYHSRDDAVVSCLKKVCGLANEGVLNRKVLFEEEDLKRHKLSMSLVESVFLNNVFFHGDVEKRTCYSFVHHSFQEFLAVLYYALSGEGESGRSGMRVVRESTYLPEVCKGKSLMDLLEKHPHLALPIRFLFGLLNQAQIEDFNSSAECSLSFQGTTAMITWLFGGEITEFDTERLLFLYETRDDEFMQYVVNRAVNLTFSQSQKPDNWAYQLAFCLKACAGRKVTLSGYVLDRDNLAALCPVLKKCSQVCFRSCRFADDVNSPKGWKNSLFASMVIQDSQIQELCLLGCMLPQSTCEVLDNASRQSRSLSILYVMFKVNTKEEQEEMRRYHQVFKSPECTVSTKKMLGKTWFMMRCKRERVPSFEMGPHMRWDMFDPEDFPFDFRARILFSRRHL